MELFFYGGEPLSLDDALRLVREEGHSDDFARRVLAALEPCLPGHALFYDPAAHPRDSLGRFAVTVEVNPGANANSDYNLQGHRLRVRAVAEESMALDNAARAIATQKFVHGTRHGGSVANSYGHSAQTEGALATAKPTPDGADVVMRVGRLPANKVTHRGVGHLFGHSDLHDNRVSQGRLDQARKDLSDDHDQHVKSEYTFMRVKVPDEVMPYVKGEFAPGPLGDMLEDNGVHPQIADRVRQAPDVAAVLRALKK